MKLFKEILKSKDYKGNAFFKNSIEAFEMNQLIKGCEGKCFDLKKIKDFETQSWNPKWCRVNPSIRGFNGKSFNQKLLGKSIGQRFWGLTLQSANY